MEQLTLLKRLISLFKLVVSSPFFIALFAVIILTIIALIINSKSNNRVVKIITVLSYLFIASYLVIIYGESLVKLSDNLIEKVFTLLYFPNIISYICMMIIATLLIIMTIIDKRLSKFVRYSNIFVFIIMVFLFVLTLDVIVSKNIDIYSKVSVYSDESLVVLIQTSMEIFGIWILILLINLFANAIIGASKHSKKDTKKSKPKDKNNKQIDVSNNVKNNIHKRQDNVKNVNESKHDVNEAKKIYKKNRGDFKEILSDSDFQKAFTKKKQQEKYKKYLSYIQEDNKK